MVVRKTNRGIHGSIRTVFFLAKTLMEAMAAWRWEIEENESGDVISLNYTGEKLGDEQYLFGAIAPYVEKGSFIDMQGEDGAIWRWAFDGKELKEISGKVVYEECEE